MKLDSFEKNEIEKTTTTQNQPSSNQHWLAILCNGIVNIIHAIRGQKTIQFKKEQTRDGDTRTEITYSDNTKQEH